MTLRNSSELGNSRNRLDHCCSKFEQEAEPRSAIGRAPDSYVRGPGFDIRSGHILSFLLPLVHEGQLSVTGESRRSKPVQVKCG